MRDLIVQPVPSVTLSPFARTTDPPLFRQPDSSFGTVAPLRAQTLDASETLPCSPPRSELSRLPPVELPKFVGDFESWARSFSRWLRMCGLTSASDLIKRDWAISAASDKHRGLWEKVNDQASSFEDLMATLQKLNPSVQNDFSLKVKLQQLPSLSSGFTPSNVEELILEFHFLSSRMSPGSLGVQEKTLLLISKIPPVVFKEMRSDRFLRPLTESFDSLCQLLRAKAQDEVLEKHVYEQQRSFASKPRTEKLHYGESAEAMLLNEVPCAHPSFSSDTSVSSQAPQPCPSYKGKGRGKGKGEGRGRRGKGRPEKPETPELQFKAMVVCKYCNKTGHYESRCFSKAKVERAERRKKTQEEKMKQEPQASNKKRKTEQISFISAPTTLSLGIFTCGRQLNCILDTGATRSAISSRFIAGLPLCREQSSPVKLGNGDIIFSLGTTSVPISLGKFSVQQSMMVLETSAFDAVLGMDFLNSPDINGLLFRPPRLVARDEMIPLTESPVSSAFSPLLRLFHSESYTLVSSLRSQALKDLNVRSADVMVDLFASAKNAQEPLFCTRKNSA
jgi:hypothetical protein